MKDDLTQKDKIDNIINTNQFDRKYIETKEIYDELEFNEEKINIIYYNFDDDYNKSLIILNK